MTSKRKLFKTIRNKDSSESKFFKDFGQLHPINEIDAVVKRKVQIVNDEESSSDENDKKKCELEADFDLPDVSIDEIETPYQKLLNELKTNRKINSLDFLHENGGKSKTSKKAKMKNGKSSRKLKEEDEEDESETYQSDDGNEGIDDSDENAEQSDDNDDDDKDGEDGEENLQVSTYAQEVLCKDNSESEESYKNDPFHIHFENDLESSLIEKLASVRNDHQTLMKNQQNINWPGLGSFSYTPYLSEAVINLTKPKELRNLHIKQRILERINGAVDSVFKTKKKQDDSSEGDSKSDTNEFKLEPFQHELLSIAANYVDFYHSNVDIKMDSKIKFVYVLHAINHILKTRSRIITHNDKLKQNKNNADLEYRDQGLTRPKVLILVPFRKHALKIIKIMISLLMRKSEEFVSNKKRFFDSFGPDGVESIDELDMEEINKTNRSEDFYLLFSGNTDDHFKIGLSVSKKSVKLFTEFYSSDIIIASPLGLKAIIEGDEAQKDHDFLSSIELLILDNTDVLLMQNWEHVLTVFEHLHLQPKKSHDTDFSRVRHWLLEGHAKFYRQTLVFSGIPAPAINNIFNRYCNNYAGKCQINLMKLDKYQQGVICQIGFQLSQVFHKIDCDTPAELPEARFNFFINHILPKFKDAMMQHTLIFIPSYFDFVKLRNYFKKNDLNSVNLTEYMDDKNVNKSRYFFYHDKAHFMLMTERFHFYKRYKIRGINHLIFYELPHYAEYYSSFCNFIPDMKRIKLGIDSYSTTVIYSKFDAQKLCSVVGYDRATHMINSEKHVHMFMTDDN